MSSFAEVMIDFVYSKVYEQVSHTEPIFSEFLDLTVESYNHSCILLSRWIPDEFAEYTINLYTTFNEIEKSILQNSNNCTVYVETRHVIYGPHNVGYPGEQDGIIQTDVNTIGQVIEDILMIFGLDYHQIRKQHIIQITDYSNMSQSDCSICLEPFNMNASKLSVCQHIFCNSCLCNWLAQKKNCPLCRSIV